MLSACLQHFSISLLLLRGGTLGWVCRAWESLLAVLSQPCWKGTGDAWVGHVVPGVSPESQACETWALTTVLSPLLLSFPRLCVFYSLLPHCRLLHTFSLCLTGPSPAILSPHFLWAATHPGVVLTSLPPPLGSCLLPCLNSPHFTSTVSLCSRTLSTAAGTSQLPPSRTSPARP